MDNRTDKTKKRKKILNPSPTNKIIVTRHNSLRVRDVRGEGVIQGVVMRHSSHLKHLTNNSYHQKELPVKQASQIISHRALIRPLASERRNLNGKNAVIALLTPALNRYKNKTVGGVKDEKKHR